MKDFLAKNIIPLMPQSDSTKVMTSKIMNKILRKERTQQALAEPKCQKKNRSERMAQEAKNSTHRLMEQNHCLPQHWCCVMEMARGKKNHASRKGERKERVPLETEEGRTIDLSRFRFSL